MPDKQPAIPFYTPADLMRYATGHMPPVEMYALEKAALEDPFLAEALDGYMDAVATQPVATVQEQSKRLIPVAQKKEAVVVPIWQRKSVRLAVAALFIAGAGWSIFSLLQKPAAPTTAVVQQAPVQPSQSDAGTHTPTITSEVAPPSFADSPLLSSNLVAKNKETTEMSTATAPRAIVMEKKQEWVNDFTVSAVPYGLQMAPGLQIDSTTPGQDVAMANAEPTMRQESRTTALALRRIQAPEYIFKGQITDAKNNPVPYANVMVDKQDFGTYSDVSGHFNFISEDSVLHIRVRSVGYTNQALALQTNRPETHIVLQEDQQLANSLPLTVQSKMPAPSRGQKSIIERDSIVGLDASNINTPYYDLYLLNNNRISPLPTLNRQVQLSFDVSQTGEATNITIVKSSGGKALDEEAIRLVKEGPKLNVESLTGKKKKVTVRF